MTTSYTCSQGHRWEASPGSPPASAGPLVCPVCGAGDAEATVVVAESGPAAAAQPTPLPLQETLDPAAAPPVPLALQQTLVDAECATDGLHPGVADGARTVPPALATLPGYEILAELGRGSMGVVFKARQLKLHRLVALKMILGGDLAGADGLARFRAEAEAVAQLRHPNIVQIYDSGEQGGTPFFALEFVDGGNLADKLRGTPMPPRQAAGLAEILAGAVHAAHEQGIVHRDLKPANILLERDGTPKIADFGLAKHLGASSGQTASGAVMGTPSYMAPEQAAGGARDVGPAADVYALGAILYELLTGRPPFRAASAVETLMQVIHEEPVTVRQLQPGVPRDLETICHKAMARDAGRRYATARELTEDLHRYLSGEPIAARPMGRLEQLGRWCRLNPVAVCLLVAVTLGSAAALWGMSRLSRELVERTALDGTRQQAEMLVATGHLYTSEVVARVGAQQPAGSVPDPTTFVTNLSVYYNSHRRSPGIDVRIYSDYPFPWRKDGRPKGDFETQALASLQKGEAEHHIFQESKLRYAVALRMESACVKCHNEDPQSPYRQWQEGDVCGVLEISRPLYTDETRVWQDLRGTVLVGAGVGVGLLVLAGVWLVMGRRRSGAPESFLSSEPSAPVRT